MANPPPYHREYSFSDYQANNPSDPLPGPQVDNELENIEAAINGTISALGDVRRADGALVNGIVTLDSLDATVAAGVGAGALASAEAAAASADAAASSAAAAAASATAADGSADASQASANQAATSRNEASTFSDLADTARTGAQTARDFAAQWASAPEDTTVDDGVNPPNNSAYHWAQVALGAATGALPDGSVTEPKLSSDVAAKLNGALQSATHFSGVSLLLADTVLDYSAGTGKTAVSPGQIVNGGEYQYAVADAGAADHHLTTAGGVKLYVLPTAGAYHLPAFGAALDGITDDAPQLQKMLDAAPAFGATDTYLGGKPLAIEAKINVPSGVSIHGGSLIGGRAKVNWRGIGADSLWQGCLQVMGTPTGALLALNPGGGVYSTDIVMDDASTLAVDDYVQTLPRAPYTTTSVYARFFGRIVAKSGNTITLPYDRRLGVYSDCDVQKVIAAKDVTISGIDFEGFGQTSRANGMGAIYIAYADRCKVTDCSAKGFWFKGCTVAYSTNVDVDGMEGMYPAATGGGEGYNVQFVYSHICKARNAKSWFCRHNVDVTASSKVEHEDCYAFVSFNNGYSLHSAYEYDIGYTRCVTNGCESGFALGGLDTGFADYTDKIRVTDCVAYQNYNYNLSFYSKGIGLTVKGFIGSRQSASLHTKPSMVLNNNNCIVEALDIEGGVLVQNTDATYGTGYCKISNSKFRSNARGIARALLLGNNSGQTQPAKVELNNVDIEGPVQCYAVSSVLEKVGGKWTLDTVDYTWGFVVGANASNVFKCIGGLMSIATTNFFNMQVPGTWRFSGVEFATNRADNQMAFTDGKVTFRGCFGALRAAFTSGVPVMDADSNEFSHAAPILTAAGLTGLFKATNNTLRCTSGAAIGGTGGYEANIQGNTILQGGAALSTATKGIISTNLFDTSTLPTATATLGVTNNFNLGTR